MPLNETHDLRMEVIGKTKADQIRATGADIVATPCANCKKQLRELVDYYDLPVEIVGVHELVLRAIEIRRLMQVPVNLPTAAADDRRTDEKIEGSLRTMDRQDTRCHAPRTCA